MSRPNFAVRSFTSGSAMIVSISLASCATIAGGVLAGAATPNQISTSKPGSALSAMVAAMRQR